MHNMKLTHADFEQLTVNSTNWAEYQDDWKKQEGRFEGLDWDVPASEIDYSFLRAYWVITYPGVIFVKAFLESLGYEYAIYFDTADDTFVIATNYGGSL